MLKVRRHTMCMDQYERVCFGRPYLTYANLTFSSQDLTDSRVKDRPFVDPMPPRKDNRTSLQQLIPE